MDRPIDLNRIPVDYMVRPPLPVSVEWEMAETIYPNGYGHFSTITLQSTLLSLRVTTAIHGHNDRTRTIAAAISAELETREMR
jgi:hypothetical protein